MPNFERTLHGFAALAQRSGWLRPSVSVQSPGSFASLLYCSGRSQNINHMRLLECLRLPYCSKSVAQSVLVDIYVSPSRYENLDHLAMPLA